MDNGLSQSDKLQAFGFRLSRAPNLGVR
ncbi:hypothetical protein THICB1_70314 [Thiomonas arsenitoxydans]|uniref:Uncharacterized protein n=1 Tax=Thiomonas arsenitoxydans (strain DSM 22701 / CIP 110005 / 3As) TaxID=426114 RepID=A0ABM9T9P4_THIA3|nr:hypothetical protein THICB1_70314 [Thiomonas arsenitoxydans]CQR38989.1 hypothetical protein THICB6_60318 [Thiomonas arsenitoxydans]CQR39582.1 hypothetical protein ACO3_590059 [Thiomonas arsenitoxydans]CQR39777.1 hypothetical protein ACO7_610036 [Thiomonas arsenitoxydans]CQR43380.1 hypothetical protein THICB3320430 [Thiomonas sp. CB3]